MNLKSYIFIMVVSSQIRYRVIIFILFAIVLAFINSGLYYLLKPPIKTITQLPYRLEPNQWDIIKGGWTWKEPHLEQHSSELSLIVSPLNIESEPLRIATTLQPGSGISFAMTFPHKLSESQWLLIKPGSIEVGFISTEEEWITQAKATLEQRSKYDITLMLEDDHYTVVVDGDVFIVKQPLTYKGQFLGFISNAPSRIYGLLVDRQIYVP